MTKIRPDADQPLAPEALPPVREETSFVLELESAGGLDAELAAADLWERGATGLEWRDGAGAVTLVASFPTSEACIRVARVVGARAVEISDASWRDTWKAHAVPLRVAPSLVVKPAWRAVRLPSTHVVVDLDPGPCFGSGTHASTRLILAALASSPPRDKAVLDLGCGSGILSVTAALLGAGEVLALDVDPEAIRVTRSNARRNQVGSRVDARLGTAATLERAWQGRFDLALVNVTAGVHAQVAGEVVNVLRPGASVILAGMLPGQWEHVESYYAPCQTREMLSLDGWIGVILSKG